MKKLEENMDYKIFWSEESLSNLEEILDYLNERWTQKEIDRFKNKLNRQLEIISRFPTIFPVSNYHPNLRKAVLSKQITIFYKIQGNIIYLAYIFVNKKDIRKVK
jgi:plasmid stabilization system protein ParE